MVSHVRLWEHEGESFIFCSGTDTWVTNRSSTICVLLIGNHIFTWNMHIDTNSARRAFLGRGRTSTGTRFSLWIAWRLSLNLKNVLLLMFNCEFLVTSDQRSCTCGMHWDTRLPMAFRNTKHIEGCRSIFVSKHHGVYHRHSSSLKEIEMLCQKGLSLKWKSESKTFCEKLCF